MHKLYWKIFLSFWITTTLIIISTIWVTSEVTRKSSIPVREKIFINSYANAAVATYESGNEEALRQWLKHIALSKHLTFYLLSSNGTILGADKIPKEVQRLEKQFISENLPDGIFKRRNLIISHEILTLSQHTYRLVAVLKKPLGHLTAIPWAGISFEFLIVILISGLVIYILSLYLTKPLRSLSTAAKSIAEGHFETRVNPAIKTRKDEMARLSQDFDHMAEQIEQLILSKERLLQDISHELRSPLARLQVALTLLKDKSSEDVEPFIDRMELEIERLDDLIGDILALAKLQKPKQSYRMSEVNLGELINPIIQDANFEFEAKHVSANLSMTQTVKANINEKLMHHAIENVIRNALIYTKPETTVDVAVTEDTDEILITIADRGQGVPEENLHTIFSPFFRVDDSREKKTGGFGLGLAIAFKAVDVHHGNIKAENRPDGGLIITIELPKNVDALSS